MEKIVPDCNHKIKMNCFEPPNRKLCKGKCPRLLPCGHVCDKKCNEDCTQECKEIVDCCITSPCGHIITKIACHLKTDRKYTYYRDIALPNDIGGEDFL